MKFKLLLPLATLTLLSGCGGTSDSSLMARISSGNTALDAVADNANSVEAAAIQGIDAATGTANAMLAAAAASGPASSEEDLVYFELEIGQAILLEGEEGDGNTALIKLAGSSVGGEQLFIISNDSESRIYRSSESIEVMTENGDLLEQQFLTGSATTVFSELNSADMPGSNVSFIIFRDLSANEEETLSDTYELEVYDFTGRPAVTVRSTRYTTLGSNNRVVYGDYLDDSEAANDGGFQLPVGVQTYSGTVVLATRDNSVQLAGTDLEMSVDFNNSTGTLSASDLVSADGDTGSLEGAFTVINATGSFTGSGVGTVNNSSAVGTITGSFDSTANLAGGLLDANEMAGVFAAQKD
jgi:hypothetical protein